MGKINRFYWGGALIAFNCTATMAHAASGVQAQPVSAPAGLDPSRIARDLDAPVPIPATVQKGAVSQREQVEPEGADKLTFTLREVRIEGGTQFSKERLLSLWDKSEGDTVSLAQVYRLSKAIGQKYGQEGYELSFAVVPEQNIVDGIVTIRIVEAFIERVEFTGIQPEASSPVAEMAEKLRAQSPLKTADLERYLLLINDLPGFTAQSTISPGQGAAGAMVLTIALARKSIGFEASYNSFMSPALGRHVAGGALVFNDVASGRDQLRIGGWKSFSDDAYWSLTGLYSSLIGSYGLQLGISGSFSRARPLTDTLRALDYEAISYAAQVNIAYPIIRSRSQNLSARLGFGLSHLNADLLGDPLTRDHTRSVTAGLSYDFAGADGSVSAVSLGLEKGLDLWGAKGDSRSSGGVRPTVLTGSLQHQRNLMSWDSSSLSLLAMVNGQAAVGSPLLVGAECSYGGRQYGRGFEVGEMSGDHCLLSRLELQWNAPLPFLNGNMKVYAFADGGLVWQKGALEAEERRRRSAASAGAGLVTSFGPRLSGLVEVSHAIHSPTPLGGATGSISSGLRVSGSLSYSF